MQCQTRKRDGSRCTENIPKRRFNLGYRTCLACGEARALQETHTVVPMAKSNYIVVTDATVLRQLNPKRIGEMI